jgi:uncharacterized protein (UPF0335 family)
MTDIPANQSKTLLVGFVNRVKALADEIGELQADMSDVCKEAKGAGFEPVRIREVVRWLRKIDKHGRGAVDEAEAIFDLYRQIVEGKAKGFDAIMDSARDRALLKIFAPDDQVDAKINQRTKKMRDAVAMARAAKAARSSS